jgi:hypothetical protein
MITECGGGDFWVSGSGEDFISDTLELMRLLIPISICLGIWLRYYYQSEQFTGLGLDQASTFSETPTFSWPWRFLYVFTLTITFLVGLLTFKAYQFIQEVLINLIR